MLCNIKYVKVRGPPFGEGEPQSFYFKIKRNLELNYKSYINCTSFTAHFLSNIIQIPCQTFKMKEKNVKSAVFFVDRSFF